MHFQNPLETEYSLWVLFHSTRAWAIKYAIPYNNVKVCKNSLILHQVTQWWEKIPFPPISVPKKSLNNWGQLIVSAKVTVLKCDPGKSQSIQHRSKEVSSEVNSSSKSNTLCDQLAFLELKAHLNWGVGVLFCCKLSSYNSCWDFKQENKYHFLAVELYSSLMLIWPIIKKITGKNWGFTIQTFKDTDSFSNTITTARSRDEYNNLKGLG